MVIQIRGWEDSGFLRGHYPDQVRGYHLSLGVPSGLGVFTQSVRPAASAPLSLHPAGRHKGTHIRAIFQVLRGGWGNGLSPGGRAGGGAGDSVPLRSTPDPPTVSCVPAARELVSGGPLPLPVSAGAHAPAPPPANPQSLTAPSRCKSACFCTCHPPSGAPEVQIGLFLHLPPPSRGPRGANPALFAPRRKKLFPRFGCEAGDNYLRCVLAMVAGD